MGYAWSSTRVRFPEAPHDFSGWTWSDPHLGHLRRRGTAAAGLSAAVLRAGNVVAGWWETADGTWELAIPQDGSGWASLAPGGVGCGVVDSHEAPEVLGDSRRSGSAPGDLGEVIVDVPVLAENAPGCNSSPPDPSCGAHKRIQVAHGKALTAPIIAGIAAMKTQDALTRCQVHAAARIHGVADLPFDLDVDVCDTRGDLRATTPCAPEGDVARDRRNTTGADLAPVPSATVMNDPLAPDAGCAASGPNRTVADMFAVARHGVADHPNPSSIGVYRVSRSAVPSALRPRPRRRRSAPRGACPCGARSSGIGCTA